MESVNTAVFIRKYHRISGLLLIPLLTLKLLSGNAIAGTLTVFVQKTAYQIHYAKWLDVPLVFLVITHALYGVSRIALSAGVKRNAVFYASTVAGIVLFLIYILYVYFI